METTILHLNTIISDPNIRKGQPILAGTSIRVSDIVASHLYHRLLPEDIALQYNLTLGQVHSALAYYYLNQAEMDALMQAQDEQANQLLEELDAKGKLIRIE